jgi:hypothetical protein
MGASEHRRTAEHRLWELLRTWDYGRPLQVPLDTARHRALTCILLDMVLFKLAALSVNAPSCSSSPGTTNAMPESCQKLGFSWEEYRYLVRSAVPTFQMNERRVMGPEL